MDTTRMIRRVTLGAVIVVAGVAATVSYVHTQELAHRAGEEWRSWLIPLAVDGTMVAGSMTMLVRRRLRKHVGWLPWTALAFGLVASLAANIMSSQPTLIGHVVAAWPSVALAVAYELLMEQIKMTARATTRRRPPVRKRPAKKATLKQAA